MFTFLYGWLVTSLEKYSNDLESDEYKAVY